MTHSGHHKKRVKVSFSLFLKADHLIWTNISFVRHKMARRCVLQIANTKMIADQKEQVGLAHLLEFTPYNMVRSAGTTQRPQVGFVAQQHEIEVNKTE